MRNCMKHAAKIALSGIRERTVVHSMIDIWPDSDDSDDSDKTVIRQAALKICRTLKD